MRKWKVGKYNSNRQDLKMYRWQIEKDYSQEIIDKIRDKWLDILNCDLRFIDRVLIETEEGDGDDQLGETIEEV